MSTELLIEYTKGRSKSTFTDKGISIKTFPINTSKRA